MTIMSSTAPRPDDRARLWHAHGEVARAASERLAPLVHALAEGGHVASTELLPSARVLVVTGDAAARDRLAEAEGVLGVQANRRHRLPDDRLDVPVAAARADHLERVNAPAAWRLGATGAGAVVGILDSGVDWRHPALATGYRGRDGRHDHAWADLGGSGRGSREPFDPNGHGTHVAGLAVGQGVDGALGVAPGAEWLAVRVFDDRGETTDLALLRGAEWLLAPTDRDGQNARPDLAPDVVNASWNLDNGADPLFEPLLAAWRQAGIVAVFAAGNDEDGSGSYGTVRAPGSSSLALSVGALDWRGDIWPLSRGGPTWDGRLKPDLVAPGVAVVSSVPGGGLAPRTGTSMATPLVAGAAALLRGAAPWLGPADVGEALVATAGELGAPGPDPVFGHGALDAAAAVSRVLASGRIGGRVVGGDGDAVVGADVVATRDGGSDRAVRARTMGDGSYEQLVPAGEWALRFEAPGHEPVTRSIAVAVGGLTIADARLAASGGGRLVGRIRGRDARPIVGSVAAVRAAPIGFVTAPGVTSDVDGRYTLPLSAGRHIVRFSAAGHRAMTETVDVAAGRVLSRDATLRRAPSILLVDADAWQAERVWPYIGRALTDAGYAYDVWTIDDPHVRSPSLEDLAPYGVVWWGHLFGSPGQLDRRRGDQRATQALAGYAAAGGRLLVSGQDIGAWDAEDGFISGRLAPAFYRDVLGARFVADRSPATWVAGRGPALEGVWLALDHDMARRKGPRLAPDAIAAADGGATALMVYPDGATAALGSTGDAGRRAYLAFGPESAGSPPALSRLADGAVGWLEGPEVSLAGPGAGVPGEALSLVLVVLSGRGGGLADIRLTVPPALELSVPAGWRATADGADWSGALAPDERLEWPIALRVASGAAADRVNVSVAVEADALRVACTHAIAVVAPDLRASTLALVPADPHPGEAARAELVLRNDGPAATTVRADLDLPVAWRPDMPPVTASAGDVAWRVGGASWRGVIAAGRAVTVTATGRLTGAVGAAPVFHAAITPTLGSPLVRVVTATLGAPRLSLGGPVRVPPLVDAGGEAYASIAVVNEGLLPAEATVRLSLPDGMSGVDPPSQGGVVTWSLAIAAGATVTPTARLRIDPRTSAGSRTLVFSVAEAGSPLEARLAAAETRVRAPDLSPSTVRFAPSVPRGGQPLTITLRLVNAGTVATEVDALDALPPSLTVADDAVTVTGGELQRSPGLVEWRVDVPAGGVETLIMRARLGSTLGPNARVPHAWRLDSPAGIRVLSDTLLADPLTLWGSTLERVLGVVRPGGRVRYRLTVAADGVVEARDAVARVDLPWAMTVTSKSPDLVTEDARILAWHGRLAPGERRQLELDVLLDEGLVTGLRLPVAARLTAVGVLPWALEDTAVVVPPGPRVRMSLASPMPLPGESARLVVVLEGGERAAHVGLAMHVPAGLSFVPGSARATAGAPPEWLPGRRVVAWSGVVPAAGTVEVVLEAISFLAPGAVVTGVAALDDAQGRRLDEAWVDVRGAAARTWLPSANR